MQLWFATILHGCYEFTIQYGDFRLYALLMTNVFEENLDLIDRFVWHLFPIDKM